MLAIVNLPVHLAFLNLGPGELLVVFLAILIFFGPKRLPQIARTLGKLANELRRASQSFHDQIMRLDEESDRPAPPKPAPPPSGLPADERTAAANQRPELASGAPQAPAPEPKDDHDLAG